MISSSSSFSNLIIFIPLLLYKTVDNCISKGPFPNNQLSVDKVLLALNTESQIIYA